LEVVKHREASCCCPEENKLYFGRTLRRLGTAYERPSESLAGIHYFAFVWIMVTKMFSLLNQSKNKTLKGITPLATQTLP
jgi:hypothetical protein